MLEEYYYGKKQSFEMVIFVSLDNLGDSLLNIVSKLYLSKNHQRIIELIEYTI